VKGQKSPKPGADIYCTEQGVNPYNPIAEITGYYLAHRDFCRALVD